MEKIPSFTIDHLRLLRGIYVSRKDVTPSGDYLTTFDIRLTEPNRMKPASPESLHTIEHLAATFMRNHPVWKEKVVLFWSYGMLHRLLPCAPRQPLIRGYFTIDKRDVSIYGFF